ncbi:DR2241 family protein [Natronococcus sp. A-GB7]|uniref:DR2241 family protein n=1 Tax=Natronococcus sp. A-GB7 TaxID=3037649 RepID=UPI00241CD3FE|nr:DR2241 family protein [Natronococcus sp. A-GB7]MDG5817200.1 DR2241 family protein [Natronococcus sp. A-GB7]
MADSLPDHESLLAAAEEGVDFDGFVLERTDDGTYALETPEARETTLEEGELERALESIPAFVSNWRYWDAIGGEGTARRTFLRWCERAPIADATTEGQTLGDEPLEVPERHDALEEGIVREWGQLRIAVRLADGGEGERRYELRHVDDADRAREELERREDPRDARELSTYDEEGRYRPLKTAPTLRSGWVLPDLTGRALVEAVDFFYPATIANWHRERRGELDVDHWLETAERQTGIYDVIDELPREAVDWMAEACCVDSQCLRRREWEYDDDDALEAPGGDGPFPCREPCSLVVAAARKWAILESEAERTYELELTTSELNQLAELIDAVADGRTDEIREADVNDGANRYRARYLRAKRFDENGGLEATKRE